MTYLWAILCFVATLAFAISPWLVDGFNGFAPTQFPVVLENPPIQPAGFAFGIWGLIYAWLIVGTGFGVARRSSDLDWEAMRPMLALSLATGALWIPLAHFSPIAATLLIWVMLGSAMLSLFKIGDTDRWLQQAPVAIYAGWLTAAACVATGVVLGGYGWVNPTLAALIMLSLAVAIAVVMQYRLHRAPEYGMTVIWALIGIIANNWQPFNVAVTGLALIGIFAILSLRATDTE